MRTGKAGAAVDRAADHDPPVVAIILKHGISHNQIPARVNYDLGAGVGSVIDALGLLVDGGDPVETPAEVTRVPGHHPTARGPHQPYCAVGGEGGSGRGRAMQTGFPARRLIVAPVLRRDGDWPHRPTQTEP